MPKLTEKEFAQLARSMPGASDDEIIAAAHQREAESYARMEQPSIWERLNTPMLDVPQFEHEEDDSVFTRWGKTAGNFVSDVAEGMTSPLGAATMLAGGGAALAGARGLFGLSRAARAVEAGLTVPYALEGGKNVLAGAIKGDPALATAGAVEAGLAGLGIRGAARRATAGRLPRPAVGSVDPLAPSVFPEEGVLDPSAARTMGPGMGGPRAGAGISEPSPYGGYSTTPVARALPGGPEFQVLGETGDPFRDFDRLLDPQASPLLSGEPYGILTAANPGGQAFDDATNTRLQGKLLQLLRQRGYDPIPQKGVFGGNPEPSFLVPGMGGAESKELGKLFKQQSVISAEGYHRLGDDATFPRRGGGLSQEADDFYSELELPDGRRVKYQLDFPEEAFEPAPVPGSARPGELVPAEATSGASLNPSTALAIASPAAAMAVPEDEASNWDEALRVGLVGAGAAGMAARFLPFKPKTSQFETNWELVDTSTGKVHSTYQSESSAIKARDFINRPGRAPLEHRRKPGTELGSKVLGFPGSSTVSVVAAPAAALAVPEDDASNWDEALRMGLLGAGVAGLGSTFMKGRAHKPVTGYRIKDQERMFARIERNFAQQIKERNLQNAKGMGFKLLRHLQATGQLDESSMPIIRRMQQQIERLEQELGNPSGSLRVGEVTAPSSTRLHADPAGVAEDALKPTNAHRVPGGSVGSTKSQLYAIAAPSAAFAVPQDDESNWDEALRAGLLGTAAVGMAARTFPPELKDRIDGMVRSMKANYKQRGIDPGERAAEIKTAIRKFVRSVEADPVKADSLEHGYETIALPAYRGIDYDLKRPITQVLKKAKGGGVELSGWSKQRMTAAYELGKTQDVLWGDPRWLYHATNGDPEAAVQFTRLLGAFSPGQKTHGNVLNAVEAFIRSARGEPAEEILDNMLHGHPRPNAVRDNLMRAIQGGRIFADKTEILSGNELGLKDEIPIDMWLLRALGANTDHTPTKGPYRLISEAVAKAAEEQGESPFSYMAKVWAGMQKIAGESTPSFSEGVAGLRLAGPLTDPKVQGEVLEQFDTFRERAFGLAAGRTDAGVSPIATSPRLPFAQWSEAVQSLYNAGHRGGDVLGKKVLPKTERPTTLDQMRQREAKRRVAATV